LERSRAIAPQPAARVDEKQQPELIPPDQDVRFQPESFCNSPSKLATEET